MSTVSHKIAPTVLNGKVLVSADKLVVSIKDHGSYKEVKCIACGKHGWDTKLEHARTCSLKRVANVKQARSIARRRDRQGEDHG